jgi:hypothetical protein
MWVKTRIHATKSRATSRADQDSQFGNCDDVTVYISQLLRQFFTLAFRVKIFFPQVNKFYSLHQNHHITVIIFLSDPDTEKSINVDKPLGKLI